MEQLTERFGGPAASAYATRSGGPAGVVPGGMQVVPYVPQPAGGQYGHPDNYRRHTNQPQRTPANPYGVPYLHGQPPQQQPQAPVHYGGSPQQGYAGAGPHQPPQHGAHQPTHSHAGPPAQPVQGMVPGQPLTQQIFIPNDMVGAIIGKGGAKINEIRQLSGSVIKINEPQDNSNERLVTITGTSECNQMALYMLYSRLGKTLPQTHPEFRLTIAQRVKSIGFKGRAEFVSLIGCYGGRSLECGRRLCQMASTPPQNVCSCVATLFPIEFIRSRPPVLRAPNGAAFVSCDVRSSCWKQCCFPLFATNN